MAYITQIDTSTVSNQNISSALLVHTFTNTTRARKIIVNCHLDQIAGNGSYSMYITKQIGGSGSAYKSMVTSESVASGVTAFFMSSIILNVGATDVVKVYVAGLAGDTTTPDIITNVYEEFVNVDASGNPTSNDSSGVTTLLARLGAFTGTGVNTVLGFLRAMANKAAGISTPSDLSSSGTFTNTTDSLEAIRDAGSVAGAGAVTWVYTLTLADLVTPIRGASVWATSDLAGTLVVASGVTDVNGTVTFYLDAGTYYYWRQLAGYDFVNPDTEAVA